MNLPRTILVLLLAALAVGIASAQPEIAVRFFDKRIYYTDSEVFLKITITNPSASPYRFKLAEERMFSLAFEARTPSNRLLDASDTYKRTIASGSPVFYREIALQPGEEYSFVEDLRRYVRMDEAGVYRVRVLFHPELLRPDSRPSYSPDLVVPYGPEPRHPLHRRDPSAETGDILRAGAGAPGRGDPQDLGGPPEGPLERVLPLPRPGSPPHPDSRKKAGLRQGVRRRPPEDAGPVQGRTGTGNRGQRHCHGPLLVRHPGNPVFRIQRDRPGSGRDSVPADPHGKGIHVPTPRNATTSGMSSVIPC
ncbi:MAG: hypothetical protein M0C28_21835 [Candidatus Moduliflexus flocculans]|nr:hypothetical protein [Candidatus Moduliflexus flocculans]